MMKRIYDWIAKANQVLLFLVLIGGAVLIADIFFERRRHYEPPHVSVAQSAEEAKASTVDNVVFLGESSGVYVLGIMKVVVTPPDPPWIHRAYLGNEELSRGQIVNVVFSKGEQPVRRLLQNDGLVISQRIAGEIGTEKIKASVFLCVTEDTDGNHRLDDQDRSDLYVVSAGLEKPDVVVKGAQEYRIVSPTRLVVKTGDSKAIQFWEVDIETQAKKEILWK